MRALFQGLAMAICLCACGPGQPPLPPGVVASPELGNNWMVINYWAIWCAPCREEIPELNLLALRAPGIDVYAVNFDDVRGDELTSQAAELGIEFPLLADDPGPAFNSARPTVLPTTLIVDPSGTVATRLIGPQTEESILRELGYARTQAQKQTQQHAP